MRAQVFCVRRRATTKRTRPNRTALIIRTRTGPATGSWSWRPDTPGPRCADYEERAPTASGVSRAMTIACMRRSPPATATRAASRSALLGSAGAATGATPPPRACSATVHVVACLTRSRGRVRSHGQTAVPTGYEWAEVRCARACTARRRLRRRAHPARPPRSDLGWHLALVRSDKDRRGAVLGKQRVRRLFVQQQRQLAGRAVAC